MVLSRYREFKYTFTVLDRLLESLNKVLTDTAVVSAISAVPARLRVNRLVCWIPLDADSPKTNVIIITAAVPIVPMATRWEAK